jgi:hypothetical protein
MDIIFEATSSEAERAHAAEDMRLTATLAWSISVQQQLHDAGVATTQVLTPSPGEDRLDHVFAPLTLEVSPCRLQCSTMCH